MEQNTEDKSAHAKTVQVEQENNEHIYSALPDNHIRTLDLLPGTEYDLIQVQLHVVPIADHGSYEALSYMCGSTTDGIRLILCNGHEFMITANLFSALTQLRDTTDPKRLWVDAICIHQGSIGERSQQVRMMSQIYAGAEQVLVWIGENNPQVNIRRLFEIALNRTDHQLQCDSFDCPEGPGLAMLAIPNPDLFRLIESVQHRYDPPTYPNDCDPVAFEVLQQFIKGSWEHWPQAPLALYIGCKQLGIAGDTDTSGNALPLIMIMPDWDIPHVERVASEEFPTFIDFLKEATKPAEMRLSDGEAAEVFCALNEVLNRPYFQRAWIVQEIILAQKARLICGEYDVDFESFYHVFGIDQLAPRRVHNFMLDDLKYFEAQQNRDRLFAFAPFLAPFYPAMASLTPMLSHTVFNQMFYLRSQARQGELGLFDIGALLRNFPEQKSTDPRDCVFGLVGILQRFSQVPSVQQWAESCVDYNLDVRDVYLSTAKHIVESKNNREAGDSRSLPGNYHILTFFAEGTGNCSGDLNLPSWVPNWSAKRAHAVFNTRRISETGSLIPYDGRVQGESLFLSGCIVDEVAFCSDILSCNSQMWQEATLCYRLTEQNKEQNINSVYGDSDAQFEGFWRTIIADNPIGSKPFTDWTFHFQEHEQVREWVAECRDKYRQVRQTWLRDLENREILGPALGRIQGHGGKDPFPSADDRTAQSLLEALDKVRLLELLEQDEPEWGCLGARCELSRHKFIKTKQGYFGLAPPAVRVGDTLSLLASSSRPWYLRREDHHYTIVGEAWVHGLMYKGDSFYQDDRFRQNCIQIELR